MAFDHPDRIGATGDLATLRDRLADIHGFVPVGSAELKGKSDTVALFGLTAPDRAPRA